MNVLKNEEINNININGIQELITPNDLHHKLPTNKKTVEFIKKSRNTIRNILSGEDDRKLN